MWRTYSKGLTRKNLNLGQPLVEQTLSYTDDAGMMSDVRKYREVVGCLICQAACTRPDLSFVVSRLSQYFTEPTEENALGCLKGTVEIELCYRKRRETWDTSI